MDKKRYINPDNPVYISYAWGEDLEIDVNKLCELMDANGIYFKRDKAKGENSLCPYRYNIIDAEKEIGKGKAIIVVISDRYIKSLNCMYEWHCICKTGNIAERVFPIVLPGTKLREEWRYNSFHKHFKERLQEISDKEVKSSIKEIEKKLLDNDGYLKDLEKLRNHLIEHNIPDLESLREDDYSVIIQQLKKYVTNIEDSDSGSKKGKEEKQSSAPHFSFTVPDGLIVRDEEEENLFNLVSQNKIVNLVGIGGSGKSSLAYLCLNKHKEYFNEIAYVVVNNNIKDDLVEQINNTLKLDFKENPFSETIAYLRENYKSEKQNMLVLDVNETSDPNKNSEIINKIIQNEIILEGWRLLFLSRVIICKSDKITFFDFNEKNDFKFLKELFLSKVGKKRYGDFEDLEGLFKIIYYNPLLAEQLGLYLKIYPKVLTVDEIKAKLYGDYFRGRKVQRFSDEREDETIVSFLKNLINFNDLSDTEKKLLCHFVLWQSNYIIYDVIADLLKDIFESEDELIDALTSLAERSILTTNEDKTLSYKLHGLLAASLREQIDISKEDYSKYLDNIEKIIGYGYYKFLPYVDCIGNSLCEYDITTDSNRLWNVALKCYNTWKASYSEKLYNKTIKILLNKLSSDKNNLGYQNNLANSYDGLANLQQVHLGDYKSAESNYKNAIVISKKLPKKDPLFLSNLATWHNNLAILQKDHLGEYQSAEKNYNEAIKISEELPKDNPIYLNNLAVWYINLADLQKDHLGEYKSAESNYKKAIGIGEQLPKNPNYQNNLARVYNNFANLQKDHFGDYESAKENYEKAIEIREQILEDNPNYQSGLASSYNRLAKLQSNHLGDYGLAGKNYKKAIDIWEKLPKDNPEYQNELASAYNNLAYDCYRIQKKFLEAVAMVNKAIDIAKELSEKDSKYLIYWIGYNHSYAEIIFDNNEVEKAKEILEEIKPLAEKCLDENSNDSWTQHVNKEIDELLEKCS